jgi:molybdopterin-containing oxidoreductase family iron-sulfur binding subunit
MANGMERRHFLKVLGVSGAGAGLTACGGTDTMDRLIPYVVPHEDIVPGVSTWYRTTCRECPAGCGMSVRTREGRAVKAEGNPLSPISHGRLCARGQASMHGLYNPDRVRQALARTEQAWDRLTWDDAEQRVADALAANRGRAVFLTEPVNGSFDRLIDDFCAAFGIERVRWEPFVHEALRAGYGAVFGGDGLPVHDFSRADVVITFGADFLETWLSPIDYAHGYVRGHAYDGGRRGRLISVGPHQSLTGMNADEWVPCRPGTEHLVALALARLVANGTGVAAGAAALVDVDQAAQAADVSPERLRQIAAAFSNGGRSLAVGPGIASSHAAAVDVARGVALLNQAAGNVGNTVHLDRREQPATAAGSYAQMQQLVGRMSAGDVGALLVHGPNPVYALPDADGVRDALANVPFVASFSPYLDETSALAHVLLPDHHFLESWDDYVPRTGVTALIQPVMTPVFDTKQTGDVLLSIATRANAALPTQAATYYDYLRERWSAQLGGGTFENAWREALKVGFVLGSGAQDAGAGDIGGATTVGVAGAAMEPQAGVQAPATAQATGAAPPPVQPQPAVPEFGGDGEYVLIVYPSYKYYDGRLANRPWLQELPDPVTKFTWSSCVEVNPDVAEELGLDDGHIAEVSTPAGTVELAVWRNPTLRRDTIAIQLGQGHEGLGTYAQGRGVNPIRLLGAVADPLSGGFVWQQTRASLRHTGRWEIPTQSGMQEVQHGRGIALAMSLNDAVRADQERGVLAGAGQVAVAEPAGQEGQAEEGGHEVHPQDAEVVQLQGTGGFAPLTLDASPTGYPPPGTHYGEYTEVVPRWGMTIDLEKCIGCSACMTACYAENNIGIVGPEQVEKGRILHWIRIERYFEGAEDGTPDRAQFLPMMCQHCGTAPCEPVCPVYASYHTPDGLNAQVYNRCVGTRYCANNCPYKVRYFNYFSYEWPEPLNWQLNPDVTVREKGVMEKCTMCVQRIREAENDARLQDRGVRDGEIQTACAQTCPGDAIVFGNLRDPNSRVARLAASGRGYRVFEHLNTQSAITYLKKVVTDGSEG